MRSWESTKKKYIDWLSNTPLKKEFAKNVKYNDFSLWWVNKLVDRDNLNEQLWYEKLNKKFGNKKFDENNNYFFYIFILKLIKSFLRKVLAIIFIKLFIPKKNISNKKDTCLYSLLSNFKLTGKNYTDYQFGRYGLSDTKNKIYFLDIIENFNLILNFKNIKKILQKIPCDYAIDQHFIKIKDVFDVYLSLIINLFRTKKILKKKNFFLIKNSNCENILRPKLLESYCGVTQDYLLKGLALKNFLTKIKCKNLVTYFEFFPRARSLYYYAKKAKVKNIVSFQHGSGHFENALVFNLSKKEFSNKMFNNLYSPKPDIICCQSEVYYKLMSKIFGKKFLYTIGSLKYELSKKFQPPRKIRKNYDKRIKILIVAGLYDWPPFSKLLNKCKLNKFKIFLSPHPVTKTKCVNFFKENFRHEFKVISSDFYRNLNERDYIICGDSSLGIELAINKYNVFRVYDKHKEFISNFIKNQDIVTVCNSRDIESTLKRKVYNNKHTLIKNFFFKYDRNASNRLEKILKNYNQIKIKP